MSFFDYLLLRTPPTRMGAKKRAAIGSVSGARIGLSFLGIVLGIVASFYVTDINAVPTSDRSTPNEAQQLNTSNQAGLPTRSTQPAASPSEPKISNDFSWRRFLKVGLISLVICGLTYQGLYFSLRLYQNEPAWLILFISFQYGYFWQSVVKAVAT